MRLTIERMRTLILVAGILLLAALVVFLAVGKGKNPFNRRDLPKQLGMEIQQEANGVTYTQARGGHTLFKIHASKVVQLKKGNALLHDVKIELYGEDGSRVDRIEGSEFEYDQKAGTAKAMGPVEITLMRPGVAPAIAPKAAAGQVVGEKPKGAPMAAVAEAAARGEVRVKTSGLTFDQNSGVAKTSERVDFSMVQGVGSSQGATFDSQQGLLVLDHSVELAIQRGAETIQLHAQHAEFERAAQLCNLHMATVGYQGGDVAAGNAKILFRDDGSAARLEATNGFKLTTASGAHLTSPAGQMDFDERSQPRRGHLAGGVTMDSSRDSGGWRRRLRGSSPAVDLEFTAQGKLRHAHLERGVVMDSLEQSQRQSLNRHWRSSIADVEFRNSGHGQIEPGAVRGTGGVVLSSESQRGKEPVALSRLSADEATGSFGPGSALTAINGAGHASIEETTASGTRQNTSGDRLEAHFAAPAQRSAKPGAGGEDQLQSVVIEGHVVLTQKPAAKPGAPPPALLRATSGRAVYEAAGEWLHLTLNPRVENGAMQITAVKVDVSRASGDAFAHGNVKASWTDANAGSNGNQGSRQGGVALGGRGPAHVIAAEAQLHTASSEATFRGHARLWQQANSVAAPVIVIVLDRARQSLAASTRNAAEPVRVVLVTEASAAPGKARQPSVIRVRGGEMKYSEAERKVVMHCGVLNTVVAETGTATSISNDLEITLLPVGKGGSQSQVNRMTARGHVVLTSEGRRGTGEQLVFTGATDEYVLTGTAAVPPRITDPARGSVSGDALIFHGRDDSVSIEGRGHKATTQTMAPK